MVHVAYDEVEFPHALRVEAKLKKTHILMPAMINHLQTHKKHIYTVWTK